MTPPPSLDTAAAFEEAFLTDLRMLVNMDSGTYRPEGVAQVAAYLRPRFAELGCEVELRPGKELGPQLVARHTGTGHGRVLLIGHMDTVFPEGEPARRPFTIKDGRALGPGVFDMKSGLLVGLYALRLLHEAGEAPYATLTFLCNSDEEIGSPESGPLVRALAHEADAAIVLEPGRERTHVTVARKGVGMYTLEVSGVAAHAGVEPEKGSSAIAEIAQRIVAIQALNGTLDGVTLNVGTVSGGERPNIVPDHARAQLDVRAPSAATAQAIDATLRELCATPGVAGTTLKLSGGFVHQPFEQSPASAQLFALAQESAAELGMTLVGRSTGGGSDGNTTAAEGVATLDGMGLTGGLAHNSGEFATIADIAPRIALLAGLLRRLGAAPA